MDEIERALYKPIIVHPSAVPYGCPERLKEDIVIDRLAQILKGERGICTETEMLAWLSTATLASPLSEIGYKAYFYLFYRWARRKGIDTSFMENPHEPETLEPYEKAELEHVMRRIWDASDEGWRAKHKELEGKEKGGP